ncbi:molybdopterin cofactor-binding domain-containing protein [Streptomyces sp. NPDC005921]
MSTVASNGHRTAFVDNDRKPTGHGRMLRKEDPRFVRGKGRYVDDLQLPGMLHLAVLRSPLAHARIVSVDTTLAEAHPKVRLVVTGAMLAEKGLAWMPTLSNDVQAVLATDKVRFQGQEVAFVVAEDRYAARDALELIDVEYEALDPVIDVRTALSPDAPVIRDDLEGKSDNHVFDWETGDEAGTDAVFARADVVVTEDIVYPRVHPAPMETCGAVADYDAVDGKLTLWSTTQAPHAHRTLYAIVAGQVWDTTSGKLLKTAAFGEESETKIDRSGRVIALAGSGTYTFWNIRSGRKISYADIAGNRALAFSQDGRLFATDDPVSNDVIVIDVATGRAVGKPTQGHRAPVDSAAFSADDRTLVTASGQDGTAKFWNVARP